MNFNDNWINLVMNCVTLVSYSFKVNRRIVGNDTPTRGLRQGDPLSPYLFVLCSQGLSTILNQSLRDKGLLGIRVARNSLMITHLFFADDSLIFFNATNKNCDLIKDNLKSYEKASGQQINYDKSAITFSKHTPKVHITYIQNQLHLPICQGHDLYLGLPTFSTQSKRIQFRYLRDRVAKKIDGWKNKYFSEGGRETLIKVVIQVVPTYATACFRISSTICQEIEKMTANFWWGTKKKGSKIHWKAWTHLLERKDNGGLGFMDLNLFNKALLTK